jgi:hypothetical protein
MKPHSLTLKRVAVYAFACILAEACSRNESAVQVQSTPTPASAVRVPAAPAAPVARPVVQVPISVRSSSDQAAASWVAIKDYTFDQKSSFVGGASALVNMLNGQIGDLNARRASMPSTTDTKDWDFSMRDLVDSATYLRSMIDEAGRSTPDAWDQEKDKVDQAWQKAQAAYDKVKTATTF